MNGNKIQGAAFVAALLALMLALVLTPVALIARNVTAYSELEDRCEAMGGVYFGQNNPLCLKRSAVISKAALERPPVPASAYIPTYPNGEPCGANKACAGISKRRDALACSDGRLPESAPECVAWREWSKEARQ